MRSKYIDELIRKGIITFSEDAEEEFDAEKEDKEADKEEDVDEEELENDVDVEEAEDEEDEESDDELPYDVEDPEFNFDEGEPEEGEFEEEEIEEIEDIQIEEEQPKEIKKIQTVDIVTKSMGKFDEYAEKIDLNTWLELNPKQKGSKNKLTYWNYVEDMHKYINTMLGYQDFGYVKTYNDLFEKLTNGKWNQGLSVYSNANYGKPYITEGLYLLMYELSIDWACFIIDYLRETPTINKDDFENDSFVRKYPNLTLLTYLSKLFAESDEFNELMTSKEAFEAMTDDTTYNITMKQVQAKSEMFRAAGESLTYYANLVKNDLADITVGALDKLGTVIFLSNHCRVSLRERLQIIPQLIKSSMDKRPILTDDIKTNRESTLKVLSTLSSNIVLARAEARIELNLDQDNYIMKITNQ